MGRQEMKNIQILFSGLMVLLPCIGVFGQNHSIFKEFQDPIKAYTVVPFWSWNGTLNPNEEKLESGLIGRVMLIPMKYVEWTEKF